MKYLTVKEVSAIWKTSERNVVNYCSNGRIPGAVFVSNHWQIPEDASFPQRKKKKSSKKYDLLTTLINEKKANLGGGIYHQLQIGFAYNSNHIEGSKLSFEQTRLIFETSTLGKIQTNLPVDDIIETFNHFRCFDYIVDMANYQISESMIKQLHYLLKRGTSDERKPWFNVGEYKALPNEVGGRETCDPTNVKKEVQNLIKKYNKEKMKTFEEIIEFHKQFESIHPFQDGNGRVGRLILFKECLRNNIIPVLILDDFKEFYYRGLNEWNYQRGFLLDTCRRGQDIVEVYLKKFNIIYKK